MQTVKVDCASLSGQRPVGFFHGVPLFFFIVSLWQTEGNPWVWHGCTKE